VQLIEINMPKYLKTQGLFISILGISILILSMLQLNKNLSAFPTPKSKSQLIQSGLYKHITPPVYTGILLACSGYALYSYYTFKILVTLLLSVLL